MYLRIKMSKGQLGERTPSSIKQNSDVDLTQLVEGHSITVLEKARRELDGQIGHTHVADNEEDQKDTDELEADHRHHRLENQTHD